MAAKQGIKTIFGSASISRIYNSSPQNFAPVLSILKKYDVNTVDTAQMYVGSEELLGSAKTGTTEGFIVDSKLGGGFVKGTAKRNEAVKSAKETIRRLSTDENGSKIASKDVQLDVYYIHAPDPEVPIAETLEAIHEIHQMGLFKRFGLSNFPAKDVEQIYHLCQEKGYVLPSVYQGNYSAIARLQETLLFPTLRRLGMSFYAYSPIAGGFLTKTKQQVLDGAGRFNNDRPVGAIYVGMYQKDSYLDSLSEWEDIAKEAGCSRADLAYRWVKYNSPLSPEFGDGIIIGASSNEQLEQTLEGMKAGPLSEATSRRIDGIWEKIKHDAPLDNYHG